MSLRKQFETNASAEIDGVWIEEGVNEDGSIPSFLISRMGKSNKRYTKAIEKATRPHRRAIELETMDNALAEKIFMGVFVETVLLDWKNIKMSDITGNEKDSGFADFTKENATALFEALPELYEDLQDRAKKAAIFRSASLEDSAKN